MTSEEAIAMLKELQAHIAPEQMIGFNNAILFGIAAIKRIDNIRNIGSEMPGALLPGETEK